jgi:hypothetical protein
LPPFQGPPTPPSFVSTPLRGFEQILDDIQEEDEGHDEVIGCAVEKAQLFDAAGASLAEQSKFYSALLHKVDIFTEGTGQALQAAKNLDPEIQQELHERIRHRGLQLQDQLDWAETSLQDEAIEEVRAFRTRARITRTPPAPPRGPRP